MTGSPARGGGARRGGRAPGWPARWPPPAGTMRAPGRPLRCRRCASSGPPVHVVVVEIAVDGRQLREEAGLALGDGAPAHRRERAAAARVEDAPEPFERMLLAQHQAAEAVAVRRFLAIDEVPVRPLLPRPRHLPPRMMRSPLRALSASLSAFRTASAHRAALISGGSYMYGERRRRSRQDQSVSFQPRR